MNNERLLRDQNIICITNEIVLKTHKFYIYSGKLAVHSVYACTLIGDLHALGQNMVYCVAQ